MFSTPRSWRSARDAEDRRAEAVGELHGRGLAGRQDGVPLHFEVHDVLGEIVGFDLALQANPSIPIAAGQWVLEVPLGREPPHVVQLVEDLIDVVCHVNSFFDKHEAKPRADARHSP